VYVQETQPVPPPLPAEAPPEVFAFAGIRGKLRAYNVFLQGQFRHSDLTYGEGQLNQILGEAWAGVELRTASGWAVQYLARGNRRNFAQESGHGPSSGEASRSPSHFAEPRTNRISSIAHAGCAGLDVPTGP